MGKESPRFVSVHGGHSGQFCNHASDNLEEIILEYIRQNYKWVGITEHSPGISDQLLYPDEISSGLTPEHLLLRFQDYITECRTLQKKYESALRIFVGIEIETYNGYKDFVPFLIRKFKPDYIVGSVHFVNGISFDFSKNYYNRAINKAGCIEELYINYFDAQFEMITILEPAVVGHFDLIRLYDDNYPEMLRNTSIQKKIWRNLKLIKEKDLLLDFNLRALIKGAREPYLSAPILEMAKKLDISVVPGDDSHGISSVGCYMNEGIQILQRLGFSTDWREPRILQY